MGFSDLAQFSEIITCSFAATQFVSPPISQIYPKKKNKNRPCVHIMIKKKPEDIIVKV